ncbi:MAG: hypothetical protein B6242_09965, partial [Anaerolineaceae bacterium 4572_78]
GQIIITGTAVTTEPMTYFTNTAFIGSDTPDDNDDNNDDTVTGTVESIIIGNPQIGIVKTDHITQVVPGQLVTYTISFSNYGYATAENVIITDTLPEHVTYQSCQPLPCDYQDGMVIFNIGTLPPGSASIVLVRVQVDNDIPTMTTFITNTVMITTSTPDTVITMPPDNPDDNSDIDSNEILYPLIEIDKRVSVPDTVNQETVRYTIDITNAGDLPLYPLIVTDTLDPVLDVIDESYVPVEPSYISPDKLTLVWDNLIDEPLMPNDTVSVSFDVLVNTIITGTYYNLVTTTAVYTDGQNNGIVTDSDDEPLMVQDPGVDVFKQVIPPGLDPNQFITFTIHVTNTGRSMLDVVPLFDYFESKHITLTHATPQANRWGMHDVENEMGFIRWDDLTALPPYGFGRNLLPGESFVITTVFRGINEFEVTTNTAVITEAIDVHDNVTQDDNSASPVIYDPSTIELLSFTASQHGFDMVKVEWQTWVERDNYGFRLLRGQMPLQKDSEPDIEDATEIAFIAGRGMGLLSGNSYTYFDRTSVVAPSYQYWLVDVDLSGEETIHGPVTVRTSRGYVIYLPIVIK